MQLILKNNKLPKIYLFFHGYKINSANEKVVEYRKTIVSKDVFGYAKYYFIHIFYQPNGENSLVFGSTEEFDHIENKLCGFIFTGKYAPMSYDFIKKYDRGLLKYTEWMRG